ncbi:uncharacterized protein [Rhodnius prolixus]|uniref:Odorant receptor n=1 Tax=Rhodnius prolixus TaxID=13249 RepID=T1H8V7_RHOPR
MAPPENNRSYLRKGYVKVGGWVLRFGTVYSLDIISSTKEKFLFCFQQAVHIISLVIMWTLAIKTIYIYNDTSAALEFLHLIFGATVLWVQTLNYIVKRDSMESMMLYIGKDFYDYPNEDILSEEREIKKNTLDWYEKFWKFCVIITGSICFLYILRVALMFIFQHQEYDLTKEAHPYLVYKVYYPMNLNNPNYLIFAVAHQLVTLASAVAVLNAQATVFIRFIGCMVAEFRVLAHSIERMESRIHLLCKQKIENGKIGNKELYDKKFHEYSILCLKNNIKHHQQLVDFFISLQNIHGFDLSAAFLVFIIVLCFGAFSLLVGFKSNFADNLVTIAILSTDLLNIYFFCYLSEELETERLKFCNSIQFMNWRDMSLKFKKMLIIINECNKKKFLLKTNTGVTASRETFSSILTTAYSYVNVLREFFG